MMSSHDDKDMEEEDFSCKPKSPSNGEPSSNFDFQTLLMSIQANVAQNSQILASLVAERNGASFEIEGPPCKRSRRVSGITHGEENSLQSGTDSSNVASLKAGNVASTNANYAASRNGSYVASTNANCVASTNANYEIPLNGNSNARPSDEDVMSLFGGPDFDSTTNEVIDDIDNNALLSLIGDAFAPSDVTGPPIMDHLASIIDAKFTAEFDLDKRKEILDKYKVPKNCNSLFTPKVNPEIWGKLPTFVRRNDVRASTQQDTLLRVTGAISSSIEDLLKAREGKQPPNYKAIIATLFDAIAILGHINKELSFKRREALKPNLSHEFKQACSRKLKPGKFLFGDDLPETIKTLQATAKIVSSAVKTNEPQQNRQNRNFSSFHSSQAKPFLGQRGRMYNPPRMQYHPRPYSSQQPQFSKKKFTKN